jgi:hypothetical protein
MSCLRVKIHTDNVALFRCVSIHSSKNFLLRPMTSRILRQHKLRHSR